MIPTCHTTNAIYKWADGDYHLQYHRSFLRNLSSLDSNNYESFKIQQNPFHFSGDYLLQMDAKTIRLFIKDI